MEGGWNMESILSDKNHKIDFEAPQRLIETL